jgi:hypothetical protein
VSAPTSVACPYCLAEAGERCVRFDGSPADYGHVLRRYAAQLAGLEPPQYIPVDQRHLLANPQALERYRALMQARAGPSLDVVPAAPFRDLRDAVWAVECPRCHAPAGLRCRSASHVQSQSHAARWHEARQAGTVLDMPCQGRGCLNHDDRPE